MTDRLDTTAGCVKALADVNREVAEFGPEWWQAAGELARAEKEWERRWRVAMRSVRGENAEMRAAICHAAVEETAPGLWERIEALTETVESGKSRLKLLERRAGNVQSALRLNREEENLHRFVADGVR